MNHFILAFEHGSFRRAGAAMGVQESTVSRSIRNLESFLGSPLFHRHSGGVRLTFAGERFLPRAENLLKYVEESIDEVASMRRSHLDHITITTEFNFVTGFLRELLDAFDRRYSKSGVGIADLASDDPIDLIENHCVDAAFVAGDVSHRKCSVEHLWSERVYAALSGSHRLTRKPELDWQDLVHETFLFSETNTKSELRRRLNRRLRDQGFLPRIQSYPLASERLLPLVALNWGVSLTTEASAAIQIPGLSYRPVIDDSMPFKIVWSPRNDNPSLRRLLGLAKAMSSASAGR